MSPGFDVQGLRGISRACGEEYRVLGERSRVKSEGCLSSGFRRLGFRVLGVMFLRV